MKSHVLILLFILVCCGYAGAASQGDSIQVCTGVYPSLSLSADTAGFVFSGHLEGILPSEPYKGTENIRKYGRFPDPCIVWPSRQTCCTMFCSCLHWKWNTASMTDGLSIWKGKWHGGRKRTGINTTSLPP